MNNIDVDSMGIDGVEGVPDEELEIWNKVEVPSNLKAALTNGAPLITPYLTTTNCTNYKRPNSAIKYLVIHYTSGKGDTAKANCSYFYSVYRGASAHYFVDEDSIYQCVLDRDTAWHCGTTGSYYSPCRNSSSIGIEMCSDYKNGAYYISDATVTRTVALVKYLMDKYNIDADHVIRHYDVTHKQCPEPWVSDSSLWATFKAQLTSTTDEEDEDMGTIYHYTNEVPKWGKNTIQKLLDKGYYTGASDSDLNLPEVMLRTFVVMDRAGVFEK